MPIVPTYEQQVRDRPILQANFTTRASAEDMGAAAARGQAAIGQGLQNFGRGLGQMADAVEQVRRIEDATAASEAENRFLDWAREARYGQNGYMNLEGRAAVEGREAFEQSLEQARARFSEGLPPSAARIYNDRSTGLVNSMLDTAVQHQGRERGAWVRDTSEQRITAFANEALAGYERPDVVAENINLGIAELRTRGELEGWDADALSARESAFVSGVHKNIALRLAQDDPLAADTYVREHEDVLTGSDQYDLERSIGTAVREAEAATIADEILTGGRTMETAEGETTAMAGPTQARAFLRDRLTTPERVGDIDGLEQNFAMNLASLIDDAPPGIREGLGVLSGYRSADRQAGIISRNMTEYGFSAQDRAAWEADVAALGAVAAGRRWATRFSNSGMRANIGLPGGSRHQHGQAVDLSWNGGAFANAPQEVQDWVHQNAGRYGMTFPMDHEPWHIEPVGARSGTVTPVSDAVSPRATMPSATAVNDRLARITDPRVRDLVQARLNSMTEAAARAQRDAQRAAEAELWRYIEGGGTPDDAPQDVRIAAGLSSVSSAWSYVENRAERGEPQDDEVLVYNMRRYAAENPQEFAQLNLFEYRDTISNSTFKELTDLQTSALGDARDAREASMNLTSAYSQATQTLESLGITPAGKNGTQRVEAERQIAQFNNMLTREMQRFREANDGTQPGQTDIQEMINRLAVRVVIEEPGRFFGTNETETFMFEVGRIGDLGGGRTARVEYKYDEIPLADRIEIEAALAAQNNGQVPSEEEVEAVYEQYITSTYFGAPDAAEQ